MVLFCWDSFGSKQEFHRLQNFSCGVTTFSNLQPRFVHFCLKYTLFQQNITLSTETWELKWACLKIQGLKSKLPGRMISCTLLGIPSFTVTGEILKCIVIVDTLHRIEIETTTRLLYLEDSPEEMIVRGYDAEGKPLT